MTVKLTNQKISKTTGLADGHGSVAMQKHYAPIDASDEELLEISQRLLVQNKEAYNILAN